MKDIVWIVSQYHEVIGVFDSPDKAYDFLAGYSKNYPAKLMGQYYVQDWTVE